MFATLPFCLDGTGARGLVLRAIVAKNFGGTHLLVSGEVPEEARKWGWEIGIELVPIAEPAGASAPAAEQARRTAVSDAAGIHRVSDGPVRIGGVDHRERAPGQAARIGRPHGVFAGRRRRPQAPLVRAGLLADRALNVLRIGYVASEITRHGGIAICAPIAPYDEYAKTCAP